MPVTLPLLLLDLWREVGRHLELSVSVPALQARIAETFPIGPLLVRRWDPERNLLQTIAGSSPFENGELPAVTSVPTPRRDDLLRFGASGEPIRWLSRQETSLGRLLLPEGFPGGPVMVGPLREEGRLQGVLLISGTLEQRTMEQLLEPFGVALGNHQRLHELARLREAAEGDREALLRRLARQDVSEAIVGAEAGLREVMERVQQVAPTDAPVLLLGETGSGKEVVARALHNHSRRVNGPFLRVNCGAIPSELVDSELFGHEKGSFTGAIHTRKGWFERADGGTLFLDEIGELPAAAQVRLLRVLQDGTVNRVGGQETQQVDVRIVAATHRDMATMVRDGRFRQDLWYRVSVFPIRLPALRERKNDIPPLARHFAAQAGLRLFGRALTADERDMAKLMGYDWPGNVRELASVIERAAILGNGHGLQLGPALGVMPAEVSTDGREPVEAALRQAKGRIEGPFGAAQILGVNPHTLRARMRKMGIEWSRYRGG